MLKKPCKLWTGAKNNRGYGVVRVNGRNYLVHRRAYIRAHGPLSAGLLVCHHCDTPLCYEVEHLFVGNDKDNAVDCANKDRTTFGTRAPNAKLDDDKVRAIRADPRLQRVIAAEYGVNQSLISRIKSLKNWWRT